MLIYFTYTTYVLSNSNSDRGLRLHAQVHGLYRCRVRSCLQDFLVGSSNVQTKPFSDWLVHTCNASSTGVYSWWAVESDRRFAPTRQGTKKSWGGVFPAMPTWRAERSSKILLRNSNLIFRLCKTHNILSRSILCPSGSGYSALAHKHSPPRKNKVLNALIPGM